MRKLLYLLILLFTTNAYAQSGYVNDSHIYGWDGANWSKVSVDPLDAWKISVDNATPLPIVIKDPRYIGFARLDGSTEALETIDYEHSEIHSGSHFFITSSDTLANNASMDCIITTPNSTKTAHLIFQGTGSAITDIRIYEGSDRVGIVTGTPLNSDRNSSTTSTLTCKFGQNGGTTDGTLLWRIKSGAATQQSRSASDARGEREIILKSNTTYQIKLISGTNDNLCNVRLYWYEHTPKN